MKEISEELYTQLNKLGILPNETRSHNVGKSNYSKKLIQPWAIIQEYNLDYWDGDIIKRVLRTKDGEPRTLDYEKIIHICQEKLRQNKVEEMYAKEEKTKNVFINSEYDISVDQTSSIKKGEMFLCMKDMWLSNDNGVIYNYLSGSVYKSEMDACITDELGTKDRYWNYPQPNFKRLKNTL